MARPTQPASPPDEPQHTGHPLSGNTTQIDQFLRNAKRRTEEKEFQIEELEQWKQCVNAVAASAQGQVFLKNMIKASGLHEPSDYRNTMRMVDVGLKSAFYLKWVRPFLNHDLRSSIE